MVTEENGVVTISKDRKNQQVPEQVQQVSKPVELPASEDEMFDRLAASLHNEAVEYKQAQLKDNEEFMFAAQQMHKYFNNDEEFKGSNEDLVKATFQNISLIRDNTVGMAATLAKLDELDEDQATTLYYLMKTTEQTDEDNLEAFGRFAVSTALDPTTYGMLAAPFTFVAKKGAKEAAKRAIMQKLTQKLTPTAIAGMEGAAYAGGFIHGEEKIKEQATGEYDESNVFAAAAFGAGAGAGAMKLFSSLGKFFGSGKKKPVNFDVTEEIPELSDIIEGSENPEDFIAFVKSLESYEGEPLADSFKRLYGKNWEEDAVDDLIEKGMLPARPKLVDKLSDVKVINDNKIQFNVEGQPVTIERVSDNQWTVDSSKLVSGSKAGEQAYMAIFSWLDKHGQKYVKGGLTPVNKFKLPINMLKYKNKTGSSSFTDLDIDDEVDRVITILERYTNKPLELLSDKEIKKFGSKWGADENVRVGVDSLQTLIEYKLEKAGV